MGLFGLGKKKKLKEEEELEDDEEDEEEDRKKMKLEERRKFAKKLKDLNSDEAKKRKEPLKPWGRGERLWVVSLIIITTGISGFLALRARDYKLPGLPRINTSIGSILSVGNIFKGETIVLEGDNEDMGRSKGTLDSINKVTMELSGVYGAYVVRLNDSSTYGVNEDEVFQAASLIKLPVMVGMYMEEENTDFSLNRKYTLKEEDKLPGAGSLSGKPAGYEITYKNLIKLMAKESDNTAFNICRKFLGDEKIEGIIASIGMNKTSLSENETTPRDIGVLFEKLWDLRLIDEKRRDELLGFMTGTLYEEWLPKGLPSSVKTSHKVGIETHVLNDGGIVQSSSPYVIVVMSKGIVEKQANEAIPKISRIVYDIESGD